MSNKTSDKNVANVEDSIMLLEEIINGDKECLEIDIRNNNYEDIEHWKREIKAVENVVNAYYREKARADKLENDYSKLLTETDEKDKRIQELEKELENNIPKQVVIDKIKEYDKKMEEDAGHPNWVVTDRIVMNGLQELLEGRNENG